MDLALNNLQRLICHKTQQTNQPESKHYIVKTSDKNSANNCAKLQTY